MACVAWPGYIMASPLILALIGAFTLPAVAAAGVRVALLSARLRSIRQAQGGSLASPPHVPPGNESGPGTEAKPHPVADHTEAG